MTADRKYIRIADGKVAVAARLPKRLVARVDLAVAHRHLADDWVTRVAIVEECLERFLDHGGIAATTTRPQYAAADKKLFRLHFDRETARAVYGELAVLAVRHERLAPWEVIAIAILDHIEFVDPIPECDGLHHRRPSSNTTPHSRPRRADKGASDVD